MWFSGVCASANTHPHDEPAVKMRTHDFHLAASDRLPFESYHAMCLGESRFNEDSLPSALHSRPAVSEVGPSRFDHYLRVSGTEWAGLGSGVQNCCHVNTTY